MDLEIMALLDGCEMAEDANAIPEMKDTKPGKKKNKCTWRLQRREELKRLQKSEQQLQERLEMLQKTLRTRGKGFKQASDWEQICADQQSKRRKSEEENRRLKDQVKWKMWQAKRLLQGFKRRMRNDIVAASVGLCSKFEVNTQGVCLPTDDEIVFQKLLVGMDETYANVDAFFRNLHIEELPCPGRKSIAPSKTEGTFVEFLDSYAVPFGLQLTEKTVWKCLREEGPQRPKPAFVKYYEADDNTFQQSMCSSFTAGTVQVRVILRNVGRKYVEQDRAVYVFRRLIEPVCAGVSIAFQETTQMIVRPGPASDLGPTSMIYSHRQATANMSVGTAYDIGVKWVPRAFIDVGIASWEDSITQFSHFVEDTMLREMLQNNDGQTRRKSLV